MARIEEDRRLLAAFRSGDRRALEEVYRAYAPGLARTLGKAMRSANVTPFEIENLVGEVFSRALAPPARTAYDGLRPYEAFLWGIARNCLHEQHRRREDPAGADPAAELPAEAPAADAAVEDAEVEGLVAAFQATLAPADRDLYARRFVDGLSQADAARALRVTRIVLRRRERRIKERLVVFLQERGWLGAVERRGWAFVRRES